VGHSGKLEPTIKAIEVVDECLGKIVDKIIELGGEVIITADHGNSDEVVTLEDKPMTTHTTNPVPVIVTKQDAKVRDGGRLADLRSEEHTSELQSRFDLVWRLMLAKKKQITRRSPPRR